jgi:hypothetical protein
MNGLTWSSPIVADENTLNRQLEGRELDIHIKEMHAHMRGTELKRKKKSFMEVKKLSRRGKNL